MNDKARGAMRAAFGVAAAAVLGTAAWWLVTARAHAAPPPDEIPGPILEHHGAQVWVGEDSPLRFGLKVQTLAPGPIETPFELPAVVEADAARLVKVLPPMTGRIASLDKHLGDRVRPGDILFRIDAPDFAQAQADDQKARSALALATQARERQRALGAADIAASREVEQAQGDYEQARSELARADAKLAQWGAAGPHPVEGHLLPVRAPIAGRVIDLNGAAGGYWNDATTALMTVADLSSVYVVASAGEQDLRAIHPGQAVRVVLDGYPGEVLIAKVDDVGELLDPDTRRVKVRMRVDNHDGRLKPGMYARATLVAPARSGLLLPAKALVQNGFETRVYVEVQPWRFEARAVQIGPKVGNEVEIRGGLKPGERVVVQDAVLLDD